LKIIRYVNFAGKIEYGSEQIDGSAYVLRGDIYREFEVTRNRAEIKKRLAPIVPSTIWCIGLNYRQHAKETNSRIPDYPVVFAKSPSALQNPNDPIQIPMHLRSEEVDFECELAVVVGRTCKNVSRNQALSHVLGYTCANDVSARDWQIKWGGTQWCRGKTFDTFAPLGPRLVTRDELPDPHTLHMQTILNGKTMQDWNTNDMIFDVPTLIEFLSGSTTLQPGTVILTGTPQGVGLARKPPVWLKPGDDISVVIENIGTLTNPVEAEHLEYPAHVEGRG
jgi:2-keto-4-pentenoate hydratase/2-oxohepta-3-ene-1,7-dioic acid hydratase in catechol pathway